MVANDVALNVILNHGNFADPASCHPGGWTILDVVSFLFFPRIDASKFIAQPIVRNSLGSTGHVARTHKLFVPAFYTFTQVGAVYELCEGIVELVSFRDRFISIGIKLPD